MGRTLRRTAAFTALWKAVVTGSGSNASLGRRLGAMPRMLAATLRGRYDGFGRLALISAATLYVVSPVDVVPEAFLLVFGLVDDMIVVGWIAGALLSETDRFLAWEGSLPPNAGAGYTRPSHAPGSVIEGEVG
ncbi:YkvA family protein [Catellatospora sp. KI3]|uniref:YkvA family protein n=1 Tax=Catellatospora sp. KI3 TaxID=3041620 RepID=UPI00248212C6|nr:YkvA family protein [Catellatospora sp. KI3]MDI1460424.1 YkvA family protein [Catellatospora sp. KI3]